jgi:hypothetical protein
MNRPEERLGSATQAKIGTYQHFRWLKGIVIATLVLNALDASFTVVWLSLGKATEANPLMATLTDTDLTLFVLVKLLLVGLGSYLLWKHRKRPGAVVAVFVAFLTYYCILLYHLSALDLRLLRRWF